MAMRREVTFIMRVRGEGLSEGEGEDYSIVATTVIPLQNVYRRVSDLSF